MANILIVDDESGIRESLRGILEDEGYKTSVSPSGEDCLELLRKTSFDLILLDVWLTGIDGLEVLEKIREMEDPPEVIMISGHGTIERRCGPPSWALTILRKSRYRSKRRSSW